MKIKGTSLFVKALKKEGVDLIFGYPGGCAIDIFDELYEQEDISLILPRHEQGLIHAADGYARATGKVGVCLVTSGPGATNLVTGIATANYDSVPLVCFTGQVQTYLIGNDAFQEVDIVGITRNICKYATTVRNRKDLGKIIKEAFYIARTGKPGPVVIDLPKDIMMELGDDFYPEEIHIRSYKPSTGVHVGQLKRAFELLSNSHRPLFLIGGGVNIARAGSLLQELVEKTQIPVVTSIMGKGAIPTEHPLYIGNLGMHGCYAANMAVSKCDVLLSIGTRFNDRITGKISDFAKHAKIIHIDIDASAISRNISVTVPIVADAKEAIAKMLEMSESFKRESWLQEIKELKESHPLTTKRTNGLTPEVIMEHINLLFQDAIIVTDVGQHQMWTTQFLQMSQDTQLLTSGGLGTMGYGLPAAIGAKLGRPDKTVLCISGDGGMQMNIQEMATAVVQELPLILCVFNNGYLGMVRQMQTLFLDDRYSSTCLRHRVSCSKNCSDPNRSCPPYSPDFIKLAESYDAYGIRVQKPEEIAPALQKALSNKTAPTLIEFIIEENNLVLPMVPGGNSLNDMILDY
ncbi:biosynthetic-type acetolactate synthase large subunit [Anaeromicropila populeti]|uniref:Acetolactate synthase n=1 Tax=Anaeromicropila populeti TaxID=37658 RepID=A0A1I6J1K7_9FIRM|nr:biosynthetic-type acetolactate synthase large subunit [Anaeromicropila populeti]SFR72843.1 acetolactate synthase, large subunit [Anaeromicropila populeti]